MSNSKNEKSYYLSKINLETYLTFFAVFCAWLFSQVTKIRVKWDRNADEGHPNGVARLPGLQVQQH